MPFQNLSIVVGLVFRQIAARELSMALNLLWVKRVRVILRMNRTEQDRDSRDNSPSLRHLAAEPVRRHRWHRRSRAARPPE